MKVLFVCHGNVNRSAAAYIITEKDYPEIEVKSCGVKTTDGKITSKRMRESLAKYGYETEGIRSRVITQELVDWADKIFYMDESNRKRLIEQFGDLEKAEKLSNYAVGVSKIPDPAFSTGHEEYYKVIELLQHCIKAWITEKV